jgi:hypothetical protein
MKPALTLCALALLAATPASAGLPDWLGSYPIALGWQVETEQRNRALPPPPARQPAPPPAVGRKGGWNPRPSVSRPTTYLALAKANIGSGKYECHVREVVEELSTGKPKALTPEHDLVFIEVTQNPPRLKVSYLDNKGRVADRNKQYQNGFSVLLSTDSTDPYPTVPEEDDDMASPVVTLYGSRAIGSTIYHIVGRMTLDREGPGHSSYYEEIYKDGYLDATIRAKCPPQPPEPFDPFHIASSFKELGASYGGMTIADAAAKLAQTNKTSAAQLLNVAKQNGVPLDTELTDQLLEDPKIGPAMMKAFMGRNYSLSDDQWAQAHSAWNALSAEPSKKFPKWLGLDR